MNSFSSSTRLPFFVHRCVRRVEGVLRSAGIRNEPVLLGVSGGGDSMALLEIASLLAAKLGLELHVACIDHGLRPESGAEQEFVRKAAAERGAAFHGRRIDPGAGDEDTLRRARRAALAQVAADQHCRFVLLGHTSDDQVETMVFRFLRGAGLGGLAAMREVLPPLVRPLLSISREELRRLLRSRNVAWAEDSTNLSERHARGRLRSAVLPVIEAAFGRGALDHLLDVAPRWRADEDFLEGEAARLLSYASRRGDSGIELDIHALAVAPAALRSRALRRWLCTQTGTVSASRELAAVERWLDGVDVGSSALDVAGARLVRRRGRLALGACAAPRVAAISPADIDKPALRDDACTPSQAGDRSIREGIRAAGLAAGPAEVDEAAAHDLESSREPEGVLPPSHGRVRFPRN